MDRSSPIALDITGNITLGGSPEAESREIGKLIEAGQRTDRDRQGWTARQQTLTRLRYGIRRPKSFPWKGASNLSIPLSDAIIRKFKPMLARLVVDPDPVVEFVGEDAAAVDAERKAETLYTWLFKTEMSAIDPLTYTIDTMAHRGFAFVQVGWEYRTEYECRTVNVAGLFPQGPPPDPQQISQVLLQEYDLDPNDARVTRSIGKAVARIQAGAPFVKLSFRRVVADRPAIWDRDPVQVLAPPRTTDIANAEWIIVQHVLSMRQLEQKEADGFFTPGSCAKIRADYQRNKTSLVPPTNNEAFTGGSSALAQDNILQDEREHIWGRENEDNVLIWEAYHWAEIDEPGMKDRVVTFLHPRTKTKLRCTPYMLPFHRWPLVRFDFEHNNRRWHSPRGITELTADLQKEINTQHNARIDAMTLQNAPTYQVPLVHGFKARNYQVAPGEVLQVPMGSQIMPLRQDRGMFPEFLQEENVLRSIAENYIGTFDAALTSPTSNTQARTATEIQAIMQHTAATSTLDAILFQLAMRDLHTLIWELWLDLGPDEVFVKVLGQDPTSNEPQLLKIQKSEIAKKFKLIPTGTIANTNRALEMANAREALQMYFQDQSGLINRAELYRWHLNLLTYRWARRILLPPDQAREQQILREAAAQLEQNPDLKAQMGLPATPEPADQPKQEFAGMGESPTTGGGL